MAAAAEESRKAVRRLPEAQQIQDAKNEQKRNRRLVPKQPEVRRNTQTARVKDDGVQRSVLAVSQSVVKRNFQIQQVSECSRKLNFNNSP